MPADVIQVVRGEFSIEDPWRTPLAAEAHPLRLSTDGSEPRLATTVAVYYDGRCLNVVFSADDDEEVVATLTKRDDPIYDEDVVEAFLAPETPSVYFEVEASPLATIFDARIESPGGIRQTMKADRGWNCEGLFVAVRRLMTGSAPARVHTLIRIPFASLGRDLPVEGEMWWANFYRIDRHPGGDEYSAWRPTMKDPADFHVTARFGRISFRS